MWVWHAVGGRRKSSMAGLHVTFCAAMNSWLSFSMLWMITGNPIAAGAIVLACYAVADWYTFGFLRGCARAIAHFQRARRLRTSLAMNPHDRKARAELGEILVEHARWTSAIEVVKPLVAADPHDPQALWLLGLACLGTGKAKEGEVFLLELHDADPEFRRGTALLEIGRARLARRDASAREILGHYVKAHPHHVEGRFLLARTHLLAGDEAAATAERARCWAEYETSLPYQRRQERKWAWRARPSRPALYAAIGLAGIAVIGIGMQRKPVARFHPADVRSEASVRSPSD